MLKLEEIVKNAALTGLEPDQIARVISAEFSGPDAVAVVYKTQGGQLGERMVLREEEASLALAQEGRPWGFDAPGAAFKLAAEASRISLAHLFDPMMAVHTSNVQPLPHQITAVYESMLPRQPLRYVLADDPGAGKTIMAGLLIRELLMRADARRVLIVSPGSLVEQWRSELDEKFGLQFSIFSREFEQMSRGPNPFEEAELMIARLDMLSRSDELQEKLALTQWDLVVVDEAHKLSATWYGAKVNETRRFKLGKLLGQVSRHFLLMTATPHNGKEEDFQLFMSLLDSDRFHGKFRDGAARVDVSDLMRRMVKEDLVKFDNTPLFPERRAYTVNYRLSAEEAALYHDVSEYVRKEMNRADDLADGKRKGTVGFALTALQRRLASSPAAIHQSLKRRREKLLRRVEDERSGQGRASRDAIAVAGDIWDSDDDLDPSRYEDFEEEVVDQATAAQTIQQLEEEILTLGHLERQAMRLAQSERDRKWEELSRILQNNPAMHAADGRRRKLIIFTEHRDTLNYLAAKIGGLLGRDEAVVQIHGGVSREDRLRVQGLFRNDADTLVLLATDAAGEGVNLQNANLMVNYDLPWNPNRLEQRFGRIHRIGQTQVCHLWSLVAAETREGDVFQRLLAKLDVERGALGGRVFDILGEVFDERSLRDLLIEAIRYGEDPEVRARLAVQVEGALDTEHLKDIINRNALAEEIIDKQRLFAVKEEMEKAEARKLQPYFIRSFFSQAFEQYGGELKPREAGRSEIRFVPAVIREHARLLGQRSARIADPVLRSYERVCFDKDGIRLSDRPDAPMAALIHPGHPLMQALVDLVLTEHRAQLKQGAVFVDPNDPGRTPKALVMIDHSIKEAGQADNKDRVISRRLHFVYIDANGLVSNAGWAPHLDLVAVEADDRAALHDVLSAPWIRRDLEGQAVAHASTQLLPEHLTEVRQRRERQVDKTLAAVHERLVKEIDYWSERHSKFKADLAAGKDVRLTLENVRRTIDELTARRESRERELRAMRQVVSATPVVIGGALVVPAGLWAERKPTEQSFSWAADAAARSRIERIAMHAVFEAERALGHAAADVSAQKIGWDITSQPPAVNGAIPDPRHIEVKGRAKGQTTITVTRNEIIQGLNQGDKFFLAVVMVDGDQAAPPLYIHRPFQREPDWGSTSVNYDIAKLLEGTKEDA